MERQAVIKTLFHQLCEIFHRDGRGLGVQFNADGLAVFHGDLDHVSFLRFYFIPAAAARILPRPPGVPAPLCADTLAATKRV